MMINRPRDDNTGLRGRIINIASMAGKRGNAPYLAHYAASKFAVIGLTQAMAGELASYHSQCCMPWLCSNANAGKGVRLGS
jgi:NAD(P)-dependent dehydrogenase (short-subunit alcohol dehydrogenase family)